MTKQRFEFRGCDMIDNKTDETTLCNKDGFEDLVYQLNEINKENEQLKEEIKTLRYRLSSYETK